MTTPDFRTSKGAARGIPDWGKKIKLFQALLDVGTNKQFVSKVLQETKHKADIDHVANELLRKWHNSRPKGELGQFFFEVLATKLPTKDKVNGPLLIALDVGSYIEQLPKEDSKISTILQHQGFSPKSLYPSRLPEILVPQSVDDDDFYEIWTQDSGQLETIKTGFLRGKIDQKHFYIDPDSANAWSALVRADTYPTYGHCKTGLDALVKGEEWKTCLSNSQPSTLVMLAGGGAPTKDLVFLESLLQQPYVSRVHVHLVDISFFMLTESRRLIREHARFFGFADRIQVKLLRADVLYMRKQQRPRFHEHGACIFAITGGTIGNLSEAGFFTSLERVAGSGDLLIISADTIDELSAENEGALISKYSNHALRQFLRPVVGAVLNASNMRQSIDEALGRIQAKLLHPGDHGNPSDIPESCCVLVTLVANGREITLVTSTRYRSTALEAYAVKFGWQPVCRVVSPLNSHFKQFLFRRE